VATQQGNDRARMKPEVPMWSSLIPYGICRQFMNWLRLVPKSMASKTLWTDLTEGGERPRCSFPLCEEKASVIREQFIHSRYGGCSWMSYYCVTHESGLLPERPPIADC
jgi:hypothetical protein